MTTDRAGANLEGAEAEGQVGLEKLVLERRHNAARHLCVGDLVLGERLVGEDRRDGVPLARDLLLVVLVDAMVPSDANGKACHVHRSCPDGHPLW